MWSDNETPIDLLGFQHLVTAITKIVRNDELLPATLGVFGDWGGGKSSLLQMAKAELEKDDGILVLSFNGWLFEGYEDAKSALMGTILDEIAANKRFLPAVKDKALALLKKVEWFRVLGTAGKYALATALAGPVGLGLAAGTDAASAVAQTLTKGKELEVEQLAKLFRPEGGQELRRAIRDFRSDFADLLAETKLKTLVVVIDDLDRCLPDTIIETLEAIKLFLFVPRTAFILGADERLVKYAVRRRFPELPGERAEVGRDYLEKLVQFPIRVPPLGRAEMESYINLLFAKLAGMTAEQFDQARNAAIACDAKSLLEVRFNYGVAHKILGTVPPALSERLSLAQRIAPVLASGLNGNPRQCKRFLNALMLRLDMASSRGIDLKQRVLAKLMLLEYFRPEAFRTLSQQQAEQAGQPRQLARVEQAVAPPAPKSASGKTKGSASARPAEADADEEPLGVSEQSWLADSWIKDWLRTEPALAEIDLRPYFYFSRDSLTSLGGAVQRMSPLAQQALAELLGDSDAVRQTAVRKAKDLSPAEAAAVFEALTERVRQDDDLGADGSALSRTFEWVTARPELYGQIITLLESLPDQSLPPSVAPRVLRMATGEEQTRLARGLLQSWSQASGSQTLKRAATQTLKPSK
jgi:KAP family P-loop domain